jgi:hypothetical protein
MGKPQKPRVGETLKNDIVVMGVSMLAGFVAVKVACLLANVLNWWPTGILLGLDIILALLLYFCGILVLDFCFIWAPALMYFLFDNYSEQGASIPTGGILIIFGIACGFYEEMYFFMPIYSPAGGFGSSYFCWELIVSGAVIASGVLIGAAKLIKSTIEYPRLLADYEHELAAEKAKAKAEWERTRPERERKLKEEAARKAKEEAERAARKAEEEAKRQEYRRRAAQSASWGTGVYCDYCGSDNVKLGDTQRCYYLDYEYSSGSNCSVCKLSGCTSTEYVCSICGKSRRTNPGIY